MFKKSFLLTLTALTLAIPAQPQIISLVAGGGDPKAPAPYGDGGPAVSATLTAPVQSVRDSAGNIYIADTFHYSIRKVNVAGVISTFLGGPTGVYTEGAVASKAVVGTSYGLTIIGNALYFSDGVWNSIRKVDLDTNLVTTVAGSTGLSGLTSPGFSGDGGPAVGAKLHLPTRLSSNGKNVIYFSDYQNYRIRAVDLTTGIIRTVAGNGKTIFNGTNGEGQDGTAASLSFDPPFTVDSASNLYFADPYRIRKVDAKTNIVTSLGGNGNAGNDLAPDGAAALTSTMRVAAIAVDGAGNLFYEDVGKGIYYIRRVDARTGLLSTVAGGKQAVLGVSIGDGGPAIGSALTLLSGLDFDLLGDLYLTDQSEFHVRKISLIGVPFSSTTGGAAPTISSNSGSIANGASYSSVIASGAWVTIFGQNLSATTRGWYGPDFAGGNLPTSLDGVSVTINGKAGFIAYISPTQINVLAPSDTATGSVPVQVKTPGGTSGVINVTTAPASPAFFQFDPQSRKYIAAILLDGNFAGPAGLFGPGVTSRPVKSGEIVQLFATGLGVTSPAYPDGKLFTTNYPLAVPPTVTIGGVAASVSYAGLTGPGLYQINVAIPALLNGDAEVIVDLGTGFKSAAHTSYLTVSN